MPPPVWMILNYLNNQSPESLRGPLAELVQGLPPLHFEALREAVEEEGSRRRELQGARRKA